MGEDEENGNNREGFDPLYHRNRNGQQDPAFHEQDQNHRRNQLLVPQDPQRYMSKDDIQFQQKLILNDQKHYHAMELTDHKSQLRKQEKCQIQRMREKHEEIHPKDGGYIYVLFNGEGNGLSQREAFSAQIQSLKCYRFQRSNEVVWQVILVEKRTGREIVSPLYTEDALKTVAKLRRTILVAYECSDSAKSSSFLWKWLHRRMISMLKDAEIVEIPSGPGWFKNGDSCHFYSMSDEDTSRFSPYMREFTLPRFAGLDMNDTLRSLLDMFEKITEPEIAGMLLIWRFAALFGRLAGKPGFPTGLIIWGERTEETARYFLRTMDNDLDTVNIDSDRLERIRDKVRALQDTPVFFLVTDPDHRSVQNRLREVESWMQTSCMEGESVKAPFVFCARYFSTAMSLENMLVLDASGIRLPQNDLALEKFQYMVVETIERSGICWTEDIRIKFEEEQRYNSDKTLSLTRMVRKVILKMFDNADISLRIRLRNLLEAGEKEMQAQLSKRTGRLSEIFRDKVGELVKTGEIKVYSREEAPVSDERYYIYCDAEYYYFTKEMMERTGRRAGMNRKSMLCIRQELDALSMVKTYKATGYRPKELNIDFRIRTAYGQTKDLSGLAISRQFWDTEGGIALCERG